MATTNMMHDRRDRFLLMIILTVLLLMLVAWIAGGIGYHDVHTGTAPAAEPGHQVTSGH